MPKIDHKHCTGCGACLDACPQLAVVKNRDRYKFVYPSVRDTLCVGCGKCDAVCPMDKPPERRQDDFAPLYYAARLKEGRALTHSHDGGVFYALAACVIENGGAVYGCAFDENRHPRHIRVSQLAELQSLQGYKPVQSDTEGIYAAVRKDLESGTQVLFAGTPCQCAGLRGYLGAQDDRLLLVDMLCGGVTSEGVFHRYCHWLEQRLGGRLTGLRFENKRAFGHSGGIKVIFRRGRWRFLLSVPASLDMLLRMLRSGAVSRRSCGVCQYACAQRVGDISLGRFVNIRHAHPDFRYDGGASLAIVSSDKGASLWRLAESRLYAVKSDYVRASANPLLLRPVRQSRHRKALLSAVFNEGFQSAAARFGLPGVSEIVYGYAKALMPDKAVMLLDKIRRQMRAWFRKAR